MPNALVPLASFTLTSAQATVSLSGIPQSGFKDLIFAISAFNTGATSDIWLRYNGDAGNNYSRIYVGGGGANTYSGTNQDVVNYVSYASTTNENSTIIQIMDYLATDKHKTNLCRFSTPSGSTSAVGGRWASTAAITSILFGTNGTSIAAGSKFDLYGVL